MKIIQYEKEHDEYREKLRSFYRNEVTPNADQWEKDHIVPREVWSRMGRAGLLCPMVPVEYGGLGGDFRYAMVNFEEFPKTRQSGLFVTLHSDVVVPYIVSYGNEEIKQRYLPGCVNGDCVTAVAMTEPGAGSDLSAMVTTFEEDGDDVIINGNKTFISNGILCDLVIVAARDTSVEKSHQAISLFVVENGTPGFSRGEQFKKLGMRSQDTAELYFNNVRVPRKNMLGQRGSGFVMLMEKLQQERLSAACGAVCWAEHVIDEMMTYCRNLKSNDHPLIRQQAVQFALVEMFIEVKMAKTYCETLVVDHIGHKNVVVETSLSKYYLTDLVNRVADRGMEILGDFSQFEEKCSLGRIWRDNRITTIFAGTNEIMKGIAAKFLGM